MPAVFAAAAVFNSFSMTALLLVIGVLGNTELAADIGIVQSATLALFFVFSANARALVLADVHQHVAQGLLRNRMLLLPPISALALFLSVGVGDTPALLAAVLVARRAAEWIGEICLAEHERLHRGEPARTNLVAELVTLVGCIAMHLLVRVDLALSALPWAAAPLLAIRKANLFGREAAPLSWKALLPHFGSSAIVGASVYVFRISIALLVGKATAGALFTAFAIGGLLPTVYGQALAPSLARRFANRRLPRSHLLVPIGLACIGALVTYASGQLGNLAPALADKSYLLFAAGVSVIGGAVMMIALTVRARLIQSGRHHEVFGADLLANALIATSVPFVNHVLGERAMTGLYLLSAVLSLGFLLGTTRVVATLIERRAWLWWLVAALLVTPVFFQIEGGLFRDREIYFESAGSILHVPLPWSILGMFLGIALLARYAAATRALGTVFFAALMFVLTALVISADGSAEQRAKLVLLAQYLLPMFALVLGEMVGQSRQAAVFHWVALAMLSVVVPVQLILSWLAGALHLMPSVGLFSIHQYLQYFPSVVVALTLLVLGRFAGEGRLGLAICLLLLPAVAVHVVASRSVAALAGLIGCAAAVAFVYARRRLPGTNALVFGLVLAVAAAMGYGSLYRDSLAATFAEPAVATASSSTGADPGEAAAREAARRIQAATGGPTSLDDRLHHWHFYAAGITSSARAFFFGHARPPDRDKHPSAHNYWLDAHYNFGFLAIAPLLVLLAWTMRALWRRRGAVLGDPLMFACALAALYLVLGENMLQVGMRQPYPGIVTFFLWGVLVARMAAYRTYDRRPPQPPLN